MTITDALIPHQFTHILDVIQQFINNHSGTCRLEDTATNHAEGVNELPAVLFVTKQIEEENDKVLILVIFILKAAEPLEGIFTTVAPAAGKGIVKVETDEAIATVLSTAVALDVIIGPVIIEKEQGDGHVVGELVDVKQCFQFVVSPRVVDVFA